MTTINININKGIERFIRMDHPPTTINNNGQLFILIFWNSIIKLKYMSYLVKWYYSKGIKGGVL